MTLIYTDQLLEDIARAAPGGVAQIFNLLYRRIGFCEATPAAGLPSLRTACRLQIGDTAESNSALRFDCDAGGSIDRAIARGAGFAISHSFGLRISHFAL
jgi:hypothetical protein